MFEIIFNLYISIYILNFNSLHILNYSYLHTICIKKHKKNVVKQLRFWAWHRKTLPWPRWVWSIRYRRRWNQCHWQTHWLWICLIMLGGIFDFFFVLFLYCKLMFVFSTNYPMWYPFDEKNAPNLQYRIHLSTFQ